MMGVNDGFSDMEFLIKKLNSSICKLGDVEVCKIIFSYLSYILDDNIKQGLKVGNILYKGSERLN